jgi:MoaA/NifB/PqqE/SkfB family radical SAM enzyme
MCHKISDNDFHIDVPWIIDDKSKLILNINNDQLLGSKRYFIRFDLYPLYAPLHSNRHHGFWDLPLRHIKSERSVLTLTKGKLIVKNSIFPIRIKAVWKGNLKFIGYSMLHVSLWDYEKDPPVQLVVKSSEHVLRIANQDLPLEQVYISVTYRCNLKCQMCMRHIPESWDASDVSSDVLEPFLEASPYINSAFIGGVGEPLLYKDLCGVVKVLKGRMPEAGQIGLNTNGTLMTEHSASRLLDAGVNWICFSVDGATRDTYERIRSGSNFKDVIKNIAYTVEYRISSGRKRLWLMTNFVIQQDNFEEIPDFVRLAGSLGLDSVVFNYLRDYKEGKFRMIDENVLYPLFQKAAEIGDRNGVKIIFPGLRPIDKPRCKFMQSTYIWLSGEVVPCCRMLPGAYQGPIKMFGNVRKDSLLDIWNSLEYRDFRHKVLTNDFPEPCKGCHYITGLLA